MTLKTVPVRVTGMLPDGTPAAGAVVTAQLVDNSGRASAPSFDGDVVVPALVSATANEQGKAVLRLWPNARGTVATLYRVIAKLGEFQVLAVTIAVPDADANVELPISNLVNVAPYPAITPSQQALQQLQAAQATLTQNVTDSQAARDAAGVSAQAAADDRQQTGLDRVATGQDKQATAADRQQTGLDRVATGQDKQATAADRQQTGLDRVATGQDKQATAADRQQTGLDRIATGQDKQAAADSAAAAASALYGFAASVTQIAANMLATQAIVVQHFAFN